VVGISKIKAPSFIIEKGEDDGALENQEGKYFDGWRSKLLKPGIASLEIPDGACLTRIVDLTCKSIRLNRS
jgi:hypothetical protein